jgi:Mob1/phocein family
MFDPKVFPNRFSVSAKGLKEIKKHVRRTYRIFTFSYFVYEDIFREFESRTNLCERFTKYSKKYKLMSSDQFLIPGSVINCEDKKSKKKSSSKSKDKDKESSSSSSSSSSGEEKKKKKSSKSKE